jgi:hypothetical protein
VIVNFVDYYFFSSFVVVAKAQALIQVKGLLSSNGGTYSGPRNRQPSSFVVVSLYPKDYMQNH